MRIDNRHDRTFALDPRRAGALLDGLASEDDPLWPKQWPPMRLDDGLKVGSKGGHGPIRYSVVDYTPGRSVVFQFDPTIGLVGTHSFHVTEVAAGVQMSHRIDARTTGSMQLAWPVAVRWLHDALVEDAFDRVSALASQPARTPWSWWVRVLRRMARRAA